MSKKYDISPDALDEILSEIGEVAETLAKSEKAKKMKKGEWSDQAGENKPHSDGSKSVTAEVTKDEWSDQAGENKPHQDNSHSVTAQVTKDEPEDDGAQDAPAAPEASGDDGDNSDAPAAPDADPSDDAAPPQDGAPQDGAGDDMGGELSDEELQQVYSQMPPEELERHYMILRNVLSQHYGDQGQQDDMDGAQQAPPAPPEAPAPQMKAERCAKCGDMHKGEKCESKMAKSEDSEVAKLKKELDKVNSQMENLVVALEKSFRPARKAIEGIEYVKKSELDVPQGQPLSKADKKDKIRSLMKSEASRKLTEDQRNAIKAFFLHGEREAQIDQILGGK
jgi:hypothetical protein